MSMDFKNLFGTQTVDGILAAFDKQRDKLLVLSSNLREAAAKHQQEADALAAKVKAKREEADRALRVSAKISDLID